MTDTQDKILTIAVSSLIAFSLTYLRELFKGRKRKRIIRHVILNDLEHVFLEKEKVIRDEYSFVISNCEKLPSLDPFFQDHFYFNSDVFKTFKADDLIDVFPYAGSKDNSYFNLIQIYKAIDNISENLPGRIWFGTLSVIEDHFEKNEDWSHFKNCNICQFQTFALKRTAEKSLKNFEEVINEIRNFVKREKGKGIFR